MYPNVYVFLVGHPGVGKTRTVRAARNYLFEVPEFHLAPTSLTAASLVDALVESKRFLPLPGQEPMNYNTMTIAADELGTFIHTYDDEMIAVLSAFYDPDPYGQNRRGKDLKIKIASPQLNIICGTTPSNLMKFMPEGAWDQGFTSRTIMVFSDERIISDDFATEVRGQSADLLHDLNVINSLHGEFKVTDDYRSLVNIWREAGETPVPNHPKLLHYNTRRRAHLYKLSMISAVDKGNSLVLTREDFNTALNWLHAAEVNMPEIFKAGAVGADAQAMDEIYHYIMVSGKSLPEHKIVNYAKQKVPAHSVMRVIEVMERSGMITSTGINKTTGGREFKVVPRSQE